VIVNICVITIAIGFGLTAVVTAFMLLGTAYLCMWDFHRFRSLLTTRPPVDGVRHHRLDMFECAGFTVFAISLVFFFGQTRFASEVSMFLPVGVGLAAGLLTVGRFFQLMITRKLLLPTS